MKKSIFITRKIGEIFKWKGDNYRVVEDKKGCLNCDMYEGRPCKCVADIDVCGLCYARIRSDNKNVVFKRIGHEEKSADNRRRGKRSRDI